jgi:hypothetical protein
VFEIVVICDVHLAIARGAAGDGVDEVFMIRVIRVASAATANIGVFIH